MAGVSGFVAAKNPIPEATPGAVEDPGWKEGAGTGVGAAGARPLAGLCPSCSQNSRI